MKPYKMLHQTPIPLISNTQYYNATIKLVIIMLDKHKETQRHKQVY